MAGAQQCLVCRVETTAWQQETVPRRLCDPDGREPGVYRRYEPCGHVVAVGVSEEDVELRRFEEDAAERYRAMIGAPPSLRFLTPTALEESVGAVLDEHVGWQMHRGFMVEGLVKAVAEHLTSEPALAAFREAWEQADREGVKGDRVRRGMVAAIKAVS